MDSFVGRCADGAAHRGGTNRHSCPFSGFSLDFGRVKIMMMFSMMRRPGFLAAAAMAALAVAFVGCPEPKQPEHKPKAPPESTPAPETPAPPAEEPRSEKRVANRPTTPDKSESPEERVAEDVEQAAKKPRDLGPPLVDNINDLQQLYPKTPVWFDKKNKCVVLQGETCSVGYPLEFFASYMTKAYESVVAVNVKASIVHTGLLMAHAKSGHPARFDPKFSPPSGTEIAIEVRWKDADGKRRSTDARQWVRNIKTRKALDTNWVFAGSKFITREDTGEEFYAADAGELICVLSSPTAMLDLPMFGYGAIEARSFEAFKEHMPPQGTPVTLLLKPMLPPTPPAKEPPGAKTPAAAANKHAAAEQEAVAAAEVWLALVDRGEIAQGWETAASALKDAADRRDFVKQVGDVRNALGKLISRQLESKQYATNLPGAPTGQYVVLQYKSSFANKKSAIETVTPMLDKDKKWRVSGYFVK
jgi:hypothetical protein